MDRTAVARELVTLAKTLTGGALEQEGREFTKAFNEFEAVTNKFYRSLLTSSKSDPELKDWADKMKKVGFMLNKVVAITWGIESAVDGK